MGDADWRYHPVHVVYLLFLHAGCKTSCHYDRVSGGISRPVLLPSGGVQLSIHGARCDFVGCIQGSPGILEARCNFCTAGKITLIQMVSPTATAGLQKPPPAADGLCRVPADGERRFQFPTTLPTS